MWEAVFVTRELVKYQLTNRATGLLSLLSLLCCLLSATPAAKAQDDPKVLPTNIVEYRSAARQSLQKLLVFDPNISSFHTVFHKAQLEGSPVAYVESQAAISAEDAAIWGLALYSLNEWEKASVYFRRALGSDPNQLGVRLRLSVAELRVGSPALDQHLPHVPTGQLQRFGTEIVDQLHYLRLDFSTRMLAVEQLLRFAEQRVNESEGGSLAGLQFLSSALGLLTRQTPLTAVDTLKDYYQRSPLRIVTGEPWYLTVETNRSGERFFLLPPLHAPYYRDDQVPLMEWSDSEAQSMWLTASQRRWELFERLSGLLLKRPDTCVAAFVTRRAANESIFDTAIDEDYSHAVEALLLAPSVDAFYQPWLRVQPVFPFRDQAWIGSRSGLDRLHANRRIPTGSSESQAFLWLPALFVANASADDEEDGIGEITRLTQQLMEKNRPQQARLLLEAYALFKVPEPQFIAQCEKFFGRTNRHDFPSYEPNVGYRMVVDIYHHRQLHCDLFSLLLPEPQKSTPLAVTSGRDGTPYLIATYCLGFAKRQEMDQAAQVMVDYQNWLKRYRDFRHATERQEFQIYQAAADGTYSTFFTQLLEYDQMLPLCCRDETIVDFGVLGRRAKYLGFAIDREQNPEAQWELLNACGYMSSLSDLFRPNPNFSDEHTSLATVNASAWRAAFAQVRKSPWFPRSKIRERLEGVATPKFGHRLLAVAISDEITLVDVCRLIDQERETWEQLLPTQKQQVAVLVWPWMSPKETLPVANDDPNNNPIRDPNSDLEDARASLPESLVSIYDELKELVNDPEVAAIAGH